VNDESHTRPSSTLLVTGTQTSAAKETRIGVFLTMKNLQVLTGLLMVGLIFVTLTGYVQSEGAVGDVDWSEHFVSNRFHDWRGGKDKLEIPSEQFFQNHPVHGEKDKYFSVESNEKLLLTLPNDTEVSVHITKFMAEDHRPVWILSYIENGIHRIIAQFGGHFTLGSDAIKGKPKQYVGIRWDSFKASGKYVLRKQSVAGSMPMYRDYYFWLDTKYRLLPLYVSFDQEKCLEEINQNRKEPLTPQEFRVIFTDHRLGGKAPIHLPRLRSKIDHEGLLRVPIGDMEMKLTEILADTGATIERMNLKVTSCEFMDG